jgi:hypothetical protein
MLKQYYVFWRSEKVGGHGTISVDVRVSDRGLESYLRGFSAVLLWDGLVSEANEKEMQERAIITSQLESTGEYIALLHTDYREAP